MSQSNSTNECVDNTKGASDPMSAATRTYLSLLKDLLICVEQRKEIILFDVV